MSASSYRRSGWLAAWRWRRGRCDSWAWRACPAARSRAHCCRSASSPRASFPIHSSRILDPILRSPSSPLHLLSSPALLFDARDRSHDPSKYKAMLNRQVNMSRISVEFSFAINNHSILQCIFHANWTQRRKFTRHVKMSNNFHAVTNAYSTFVSRLAALCVARCWKLMENCA